MIIGTFLMPTIYPKDRSMSKIKHAPKGKNHDAEAEKIMSKIETRLLNKRNATAEMLEPSLGLKATKAGSKAKSRH